MSIRLPQGVNDAGLLVGLGAAAVVIAGKEHCLGRDVVRVNDTAFK
ncbi:MAG TPA: hypothetical protein GXX42_10630 [Petrimonas sp.]|nr:hypothetical protein [Petrimonas sp.]MEA4948152.1 hypothetical protein [Petrimonas sp.]HHV86248.1 hypothetical protein [Petrimonas sp.]